MTKEFIEFIKKHAEILEPQCRQLPNPPYNPAYINASKMRDDLRSSSANIIVDNNCIKIDWMSRYWPHDRDSLYKEIQRWARYLKRCYKKINPNEDFKSIKIYISLCCEYNPRYLKENKELNF